MYPRWKPLEKTTSRLETPDSMLLLVQQPVQQKAHGQLIADVLPNPHTQA